MIPRVRDQMTRDVHTVGPEWDLAEVARLMRDKNIGAVPVAEDNQLIGIITDRDLVIRGLAADTPESAASRAARDVMSPHLFFCFEDQSTEEAMRLMSDHQVRRMPVVDSNKRLVGMVSFSDLNGSAEIGFGPANGYRRLLRAGLH